MSRWISKLNVARALVALVAAVAVFGAARPRHGSHDARLAERRDAAERRRERVLG